MGYLLADQPAGAPASWDRPAFVRLGAAVSFAELDERAARVAAGFVAGGLRRGDRVLLLIPNALVAFELLVGCTGVLRLAAPGPTASTEGTVKGVWWDATGSVPRRSSCCACRRAATRSAPPCSGPICTTRAPRRSCRET